MTHQKDLFAVSKAQAEPVKVLDMQVVRGIKTFRQALNETLLAAGHTHESVADKVGKRKEQISKFSSNTSGLRGDDIDNIIKECNSLAVAQYLANLSGYVVVNRAAHEAMKANYIEALRTA